MTVKDISVKYLSFFEKRGHKQIPNASLIPENDPTTLFTSSGMQPLVPYLLGEQHPQGKRLVNVQNCFRAQDIDEIGDNRHTTFFRMLGNWSLGDPARDASQRDAGGYFKKEQLPWFFEFLTEVLGLSAKRLYVSVFKGYKDIPKDEESEAIWKELFEKVGVDPKGRIFFFGAEENWWSRAGEPQNMPEGEPGGPDSEVFFDFYPKQEPITNSNLKIFSHNGRLLEIGNSVFMEYQKQKNESFRQLPQRNVDFGGGLERLLAAVEDKQDMFQTSLLSSIVRTIELQTGKKYHGNEQAMRIIVDHFVAATFIAANGITPSNKEQGYILRRLIRRGFDNLHKLGCRDSTPIIESIVEQYKETDSILVDKFERVKGILLEEEQMYQRTLHQAKQFIRKKYSTGDELKGTAEISADDAFILYTTHGLSPTQIKSLGFTFDDQTFAEKMKEHQKVSRAGATQRFAGGLADHSGQTIKGHTATHLLHQALRDVLGSQVHQTGSNITSERVRFDFHFDRKLTDEEIGKVEKIVNEKIQANLPVHFELMTVDEAKKKRAIGLFDEKYGDIVKVYFIGGARSGRPYSVEFCGGPHVDFTGRLKKFTIKKQESLGARERRIYAVVE